MDLGTIDKSLYRVITTEIATDEVIITDEQISHIKEKHPESFRSIISGLKEFLSDPDMILNDGRRKDTGLIIKRLESQERYVLLVFKICTNTQGGKLSNSVISGWNISSGRLRNYLKTREVLYTRDDFVI